MGPFDLYTCHYPASRRTAAFPDSTGISYQPVNSRKQFEDIVILKLPDRMFRRLGIGLSDFILSDCRNNIIRLRFRGYETVAPKDNHDHVSRQNTDVHMSLVVCDA